MDFANLFCILHFKYILRTILPSSADGIYSNSVMATLPYAESSQYAKAEKKSSQ